MAYIYMLLIYYGLLNHRTFPNVTMELTDRCLCYKLVQTTVYASADKDCLYNIVSSSLIMMPV